ncbi:MAG: hypothetical protein SFU85_10205 [Candidatus Methylacidiphilales bacterium]|nr:hypothetical protein [Candidatus Methylacidiphilales bacterium]
MHLKTRFVLSLALSLMAAGISPLHAEGQATPPAQGEAGAKGKQGLGGKMEKMQQELQLTPDQIDQVKQAMAGQREKIEAMKNDPNVTPEQKKAMMMETRAKMDEAMNSVLTPEQKAKWEKMKGERQAKFKDKEKGGSSPTGPSPAGKP